MNGKRKEDLQQIGQPNKRFFHSELISRVTRNIIIFMALRLLFSDFINVSLIYSNEAPYVVPPTHKWVIILIYSAAHIRDCVGVY